jgi:hypothetical protein
MKQKKMKKKSIDDFITMIIEQRVEIFFFLFVVRFIQPTIEAKFEPDYYRYLQQFGYTPQVEGRRLFSVLAKSSYTEGILKLQRLYKLPVSTFDQWNKSYESIQF